MKLLLTSNGLINDSIAQAFVDMTPKRVSEIRIAFIPTALNPGSENVRYLAEILTILNNLTVKFIDIVDIDGLSKEQWLSRLEAADVIYVCGGNTYYLLDRVRKCGLGDELGKLLETRLYVGDSAGAILVTPSIDIAAIDNGDENAVGLEDTRGLGLVDFEVSPHTPEDVSLKGNENYASTISNVLYAYDNNTALRFEDGIVQFVGVGEYFTFNS